VTDYQIYEAIFKSKTQTQKREDQRPLWLRLLRSLRVVIKLGKSLRRPVTQVEIRGGCKF
jgi:hypothetical protein